MLQAMRERYREVSFVVFITLTLGLFSLHAIFIKGDKLHTLVQERNFEIERLQSYDVMLSAEISALRAEISELKTDSEETSLIARTLLGMVDRDEVIYQLNQDHLGD